MSRIPTSFTCIAKGKNDHLKREEDQTKKQNTYTQKLFCHRRSTTVSLETYPLYTSNKVPRAFKNLSDFDFEMNEMKNYQI